MAQNGLRKWVSEKWVDIGTKRKDGSFAPCGRSKGEKRKGYPKCVPLAKARSMSEGQRRSAVQRKRAAGNTGPKPKNVATFSKSRKMSWKIFLEEILSIMGANADISLRGKGIIKMAKGLWINNSCLATQRR
jgi:hypothetical protein